MVTGVDIGLYEVLSKSFVYLGQTNKQKKKPVPLRIRLISLSKPLWSLLPFLITRSVQSVIFLFTLNVRRPGFRVEKQSSWWELDVVQSFLDSRWCVVWGANWWPGGVNALTGVRHSVLLNHHLPPCVLETLQLLLITSVQTLLTTSCFLWMKT